MLTSALPRPASAGRMSVVITDSPIVHEDPIWLAWAAGLFDAEGSVSSHRPRSRRVFRPTMEISQAGREGVPTVLTAFQRIVGRGSIFGPYRGYLYYWRTHNVTKITATATLLWPWLGPVKRRQFAAVMAEATSLWTLGPLGAVWEDHVRQWPVGAIDQRALAWAAGFFCGEGSIGAYRQSSSGGDYRVPSASLVQASAGELPVALTRFRSAVLGLGSIGGPYTPRSPWSRLPQYRWQIKSYHGVQAVVGLLWPWLDERKRRQARAALETARLSMAGRKAMRPRRASILPSSVMRRSRSSE